MCQQRSSYPPPTSRHPGHSQTVTKQVPQHSLTRWVTSCSMSESPIQTKYWSLAKAWDVYAADEMTGASYIPSL